MKTFSHNKTHFMFQNAKKGRRAERSVKAPAAPDFEPAGNESPQPVTQEVVSSVITASLQAKVTINLFCTNGISHEV